MADKIPLVVVHKTKTTTQTLSCPGGPNCPSPSPSSSPSPSPSQSEVVVVPTPSHFTCPTPGIYTIPSTTIVVTETTTVCGASTATVTSGTHTLGGHTTVVETSTTVTCPVATVHTSGGVTTSTVVQTTYVCPSAGTYTIGGLTTAVSTETSVVVPTPYSYCPGTYTAPEQVVTVTETDYVYVCPFTSQGLSSTSAPSTSTVPAVPVSTSQAPQQSSPPSGGLTSSNDQYGITYTPYEPSNGACKDAAAVDADISAIKQGGFTTIRVYSTDCNTLETVGPACKKYGVKMIVGVFVKSSGCDVNTPDVKTQVDQLAAWNGWDMVSLVVVGNEAIMNGFCSPQQLATLVGDVKSRTQGSYNGPYTISETLNIWQRSDVSSSMCSVVNVVGANIHAYFNSDTTPSSAGDFVAGQIKILAGICPGITEVINLECGWPESGNCNGVACPGQDQQATAIKSIREMAGHNTVFFSFTNDLWKPAGDCGCEQSWGLASAFSMTVST